MNEKDLLKGYREEQKSKLIEKYFKVLTRKEKEMTEALIDEAIHIGECLAR